MSKPKALKSIFAFMVLKVLTLAAPARKPENGFVPFVSFCSKPFPGISTEGNKGSQSIHYLSLRSMRSSCRAEAFRVGGCGLITSFPSLASVQSLCREFLQKETKGHKEFLRFGFCALCVRSGQTLNYQPLVSAKQCEDGSTPCPP